MMPIQSQKQSNLQDQQQQQQQIIENIQKAELFDNSAFQLAMIIPDKREIAQPQFLNVLTRLLENMQNNIMFKEKTFKTECFHSIKNIYQKSNVTYNEKNQESNSTLSNHWKLFSQIHEIQQIQKKQQVYNVLILNLKQNQQEKEQVKDAFFSFSQLNIKDTSFYQFNLDKKMFFINLTGIENCDQTYQTQFQQFQSKLNYLYINFQEFNKKNRYNKQICSQLYDRNFINIFLNLKEDKMISWEQFKLIYELQIKKLIKKTHFNLFIVSIAISLNKDSQVKYLHFEDECIRRLIQKLCKLSQDKLFINLMILDSQCKDQIEMAQTINEYQDFFRFLNNIQQGVLGNQIKSKVNFELDAYKNQDRSKFIKWLEEFVNIQTQIKLDPIFLNMYQRELRNLQSRNITSKPDQILKQSPLMILSHNQAYYLEYNKEKLQFLFNSILHVDYQCKLVVLLQQDEQIKHQYYLYFSDIKDQQCQIECQRIVLNQYVNDVLLIDSHKKASLSVKIQKISNIENEIERKVIYIHSLNSDIILQISLFKDPQVIILKRSNIIVNQQNSRVKYQFAVLQDQNKISEQVKNRIAPCVIQNSPLSDTDFMIAGGEFLNDSSICNILEFVKVDEITQPKFYSYVILKEILFAKGTFIPWPYMIVLTSNKEISQYIFLPGDYGNKQNCYNQPVVNIYQNYAYQLTTEIDSMKFQWQKLDIIYDNSNLKDNQELSDDSIFDRAHPFLIQYFSGTQSNILQVDDPEYGTKWIIAKTINRQIQLGYKGMMKFQKFIEDIDSTTFHKDIQQMIIVAEIFVKENQLVVKEKFYKTENQFIQQRHLIEFKNNNNIQNSQ